MSSKRDYFISMYSHEAVRIAQPFLRGEYENIFKAIKLFPDKYKTFVVIGCGPAVYFKVSQDKNLQYIGIEPEIESFRHEINAILENKELGAIFFKKKLEKIKESQLRKLIPPKIIIFAFNIANYIPDFTSQLTKIVNPQDLVIISSWLRNPLALKVRKEYFEYINKIVGKDNIVNCDLRVDVKKIDFRNFQRPFKSRILKKEANTCLVLKMGKDKK